MGQPVPGPGSVTVERWSGMADVLTLCFLAVVAAASGCDLGTIPRLPRAVTPRQYTLAVLTDPLGRHFSGNVSHHCYLIECTYLVTVEL